MLIPATVIVSSLALIFTAASFWWMNWRGGRLKVGGLQHFAAGRGRINHSDEPNAWFIGLPLILFNTGASPLILESLRLVPARGTPTQKLLFTAVDTSLWTADPNIEKIERDFMYLPKLIKANDALSANVIFLWSPTDYKYEAIHYHFFLEAKVSGLRTWKKVKNIELDFSDFDSQKLYELSAFYKIYHYDKEAHE